MSFICISMSDLIYLFEFINWFESSQYTSEKLNVNFAAVLKTVHVINPPYLTNLSNSYTMGCPPVRGDNTRALASGLSYVQVDKHGITSLSHLHQCRPCTSQDISC